ncbi:MAG TPA: hypothetical protein P5556_02785 [Candidatus Gastranaerophilales bacterium]|nr:hypothetical protein [Candidatus Gastranaerophilales bacterium]
MSGFLLLLLSFTLVIGSSYFITGVFKSKRDENSLLFWILIVISQAIASFEALSLLKLINIPAFLITNFIIFIFSFILWNFKNRPVIDIKWINTAIKNIKKALDKDKILFILSILFIFSSLISLFLAVYAPVNLWDSMSYQIARIPFWIQHGALAHFETSSVRQVIFPPNSELLTLWHMLFIRKDFLIGIIPYFSYLASIFLIYNFLSYLKLSTARILWAIFVFASLPMVIIHSSGTQNHLILGFLLLTSLYLYIYGVFEEEKRSLIFSALALAISVGVKSSICFFLPGIFIAYLLIAIKKHGRNFYKTCFQYFLYFLPAFILLSSYFYVMNFVEFGHVLGVKSYIYEHTYMNKGIKSFVANLIRYITVFIDFTGIESSLQLILSFSIQFMRLILFQLLGFDQNEGLTHAGNLINDLILVNASTHENRSGVGILGFILFLPLIILCVKKYIFSKSQRMFLIGVCGFMFAAFILMLSGIMGYEIWNNRYFLTAAVISSPILALSYYPGSGVNFKKLFIFSVCVFSFIKIPLFNELRPIIPVNGKSLLTNTREEIRYNTGTIYDNIFRDPIKYLEKRAEINSKIGLIFSGEIWFYQFFAQDQGWEIYPLNLEFLTDEKLKALDFLVVYGEKQKLRSIKEEKNYEKKIDIDFSRISKYFDLEYLIKTELHQEQYKDGELGNTFKFYIFKKIGK